MLTSDLQTTIRGAALVCSVPDPACPACRPINILRDDNSHGPDCHLVVLTDMRTVLLGRDYNDHYTACEEVVQ